MLHKMPGTVKNSQNLATFLSKRLSLSLTKKPFCQRDSLYPWQKVVIHLFLNTRASWNWVKSYDTILDQIIAAVKLTILNLYCIRWKTFQPRVLQKFNASIKSLKLNCSAIERPLLKATSHQVWARSETLRILQPFEFQSTF